MSVRGRGITARGLLALGLASWLAAACGETVTQVTRADVVELSVTADSIDVPVGRTLTVGAQLLDSTRALLVGQMVEWASRDAQVASVDASGVVTGVAPGETWVVASVAALSDSAHVTVAPAPLLVLSDDAVVLATSAGSASPAPATVDVTNGGGFALEGLAVDSTVYGPGAADWLSAALDAPSAPATLTLTATTAGVTAAGAYGATVWLSAAGADGSPASVTVTLQVAAGAGVSLEAQAGEGQTATVGTAVATPPSVIVRDAFGNPVEGVAVAFAVTAGGGSVTGGSASTDASGVATVGSWTLGTAAGPNELTATSGTLAAVTFTATGEPGPAAEVLIEAGDGQSAQAGSAVATPPAVRVTDAHGNGLEGVAVTFAVTAGGGSATGTDRTTDAGGVAALGSWTLGPGAGANTLTATAAGVAAPATFTATAFADLDAVLLDAGDLQDDTVAATLPVAYAVRVVDSSAAGVAGVTVTWAVTAGGGTITPTSVTDGSGVATAVRVLGTQPGAHAATASVGGLAPVTFTGAVTVGSPDHAEVAAGAGQSATVGTAVATPPAVRVVDKFGNGIAGHSVTFAVTGGGGSVDPTGAVTTSADGSAAAVSWTLGTVAGADTDTLEAAAAGLAPVAITASATAGAPAAIAVVSANGQTAVTGTALADAPRVRVEDQFGNPVPGVTIGFSTTGGAVGAPDATTGADGEASTTWAPSVSGGTLQADGTFPDTLFAAVQGAPALTTTVTASAIYSYAAHVDASWASNDCTGCHAGTSGGASGLSLGGSPAQNHAQLTKDTPPVCDPTLLAYRIVSTGGGSGGFAASLLPIIAAPSGGSLGSCGFPSHGRLSAASFAIIEAWIRNGAPAN